MSEYNRITTEIERQARALMRAGRTPTRCAVSPHVYDVLNRHRWHGDYTDPFTFACASTATPGAVPTVTQIACVVDHDCPNVQVS